MSRGRLKERVNCGSFESDEVEAKGSRGSYYGTSRKNLHRGYKFHSNSDGNRQNFLNSVSIFENNSPLKPAKAEVENMFSLEPIINIDKDRYTDKVEIETHKVADSGFENQAKQMEKRHRLFVDDQPFKKSTDLGEERSNLQTNLKKHQSTDEINRSNDELINRCSRKDANVKQDVPQDAQSTVISKKRKFPGPAGLLPKLVSELRIVTFYIFRSPRVH